ncbi:RNA polymerase sigma factor [Candidatus Omnitrophota bacterium]
MQDIPKDVLMQASRGDMQAFEQIYKATSGFVYSVAYRIVSSREDAEDITQEVFLRIYNNLKKFQFRSSFKTWVYRITANTAINTYRKKVKETRRSADFDVAIETIGVSGGIDEAIERTDSQSVVSWLLKKLNPDHRACIVLREIQGLSYKEIARALKININTVRSRLKRARLCLLAFGKTREVVKDEV